MALGGNKRNPHTTFPQKRLRQESALRRQAEYNKLSIDEKIIQAYKSHRNYDGVVLDSDAAYLSFAKQQFDNKVTELSTYPKQLRKLIKQKFAPKVDVPANEVKALPTRLTQEQKDAKKKAKKQAKVDARSKTKITD
jgi:hypothetical protein